MLFEKILSPGDFICPADMTESNGRGLFYLVSKKKTRSEWNEDEIILDV